MTSTAATDKARRAAEDTPADRMLERLAERIGARAGVQAVFGTPIQAGELTVVPVARTRWGVGGGGGASETAGGSGSGGGGGVAADPIGYLEVSPSGAAFRPIAHAYANPAFVLAAAIAAAIVLRAFGRLVR